MATKSAGTCIAGGVLSVTVTVKEPLLALPWTSVAEQVTAVTPMAKELPLLGTQAGANAPSTRSVAMAAKLTAAPAGPVASAESAGGNVSAGGVVSTMVTVTVAVEVSPLASVTVSAMTWTPTVKCTSTVAPLASVVVPSAQVKPVVGPEERVPSSTTE